MESEDCKGVPVSVLSCPLHDPSLEVVNALSHSSNCTAKTRFVIIATTAICSHGRVAVLATFCNTSNGEDPIYVLVLDMSSTVESVWRLDLDKAVSDDIGSRFATLSCSPLDSFLSITGNTSLLLLEVRVLLNPKSADRFLPNHITPVKYIVSRGSSLMLSSWSLLESFIVVAVHEGAPKIYNIVLNSTGSTLTLDAVHVKLPYHTSVLGEYFLASLSNVGSTSAGDIAIYDAVAACELVHSGGGSSRFEKIPEDSTVEQPQDSVRRIIVEMTNRGGQSELAGKLSDRFLFIYTLDPTGEDDDKIIPDRIRNAFYLLYINRSGVAVLEYEYITPDSGLPILNAFVHKRPNEALKPSVSGNFIYLPHGFHSLSQDSENRKTPSHTFYPCFVRFHKSNFLSPRTGAKGTNSGGESLQPGISRGSYATSSIPTSVSVCPHRLPVFSVNADSVTAEKPCGSPLIFGTVSNEPLRTQLSPVQEIALDLVAVADATGYLALFFLDADHLSFGVDASSCDGSDISVFAHRFFCVNINMLVASLQWIVHDYTISLVVHGYIDVRGKERSNDISSYYQLNFSMEHLAYIVLCKYGDGMMRDSETDIQTCRSYIENDDLNSYTSIELVQRSTTERKIIQLHPHWLDVEESTQQIETPALPEATGLPALSFDLVGWLHEQGCIFSPFQTAIAHVLENDDSGVSDAGSQQVHAHNKHTACKKASEAAKSSTTASKVTPLKASIIPSSAGQLAQYSERKSEHLSIDPLPQAQHKGIIPESERNFSHSIANTAVLDQNCSNSQRTTKELASPDEISSLTIKTSGSLNIITIHIFKIDDTSSDLFSSRLIVFPCYPVCHDSSSNVASILPSAVSCWLYDDKRNILVLGLWNSSLVVFDFASDCPRIGHCISHPRCGVPVFMALERQLLLVHPAAISSTMSNSSASCAYSPSDGAAMCDEKVARHIQAAAGNPNTLAEQASSGPLRIFVMTDRVSGFFTLYLEPSYGELGNVTHPGICDDNLSVGSIISIEYCGRPPSMVYFCSTVLLLVYDMGAIRIIDSANRKEHVLDCSPLKYCKNAVSLFKALFPHSVLPYPIFEYITGCLYAKIESITSSFSYYATYTIDFTEAVTTASMEHAVLLLIRFATTEWFVFRSTAILVFVTKTILNSKSMPKRLQHMMLAKISAFLTNTENNVDSNCVQTILNLMESNVN